MAKKAKADTRPAKFRAMADRLQQAIDNKRRLMTQNSTPNRLGWTVGPHEVMRGEGELAGRLSVILDASGERRTHIIEGIGTYGVRHDAEDAADAVAAALVAEEAESQREDDEPVAAPQATPADPNALAARPVLLLHPNLGALAKLVGDHARFATGGVQLQSTASGYRAVATSGKVLGLVDGELPELPEHYPAIPALEASPGTEAEALIPAHAWVQAFRAIPKRNVRFKPVLGNLAVAIGKDSSTLASTDLENVNVLQPRHLEGRFPDISRVLPAGEPRVRFRVNPKLMLDLIQTAAVFAGDSDMVTVEVHDPEKLVAVRAAGNGQEFTGLIVPLTLKGR